MHGIEQVMEDLKSYSLSLSEDSTTYWQFHARRFRWTTLLAQSLILNEQKDCHILDLGNSFQTLMLDRIMPDARIDTMGFFDPRYAPGGASTHYDYDLNQAFNAQGWPEPERKYSLITFFEVIEHLHVSPSHLLKLLAEYLKDDGYLVISTPNAARLSNRLMAMRGQNPYERLRENHHIDPGHIREYTKKELEDYAHAAGFKVEEIFQEDLTGTLSPLLSYIQKLFPGFRNDLICVLRKV